MPASPRRSLLAVLVGFTTVAGACGSDGSSAEPTDDTAVAVSAVPTDAPGRATIVVSTNLLGDVVGEVVGDQADVVTIMPVGVDPHEFRASAQEVATVTSADALIVNGAGFEEGLLDVIDNARRDGVPTFEAIGAVETIEFGDVGRGDHGDEEGHGDDEDHGDEEGHGDDEDHGDDEGGHDHEGVDPHFFADPIRMAAAVDGIVAFLAEEIPSLDAAALEATAATYVAELEALHAANVALFETIAEEDRVLVTSHESLEYFADRYGFDIVGVIVPGGSTTDAAAAGELAELAELVEVAGVPAIFADASASGELAETLADEVGGIAVVDLFTESLGEPGSNGETYLLMIGTNAERVAAALT